MSEAKHTAPGGLPVNEWCGYWLGESKPWEDDELNYPLTAIDEIQWAARERVRVGQQRDELLAACKAALHDFETSLGLYCCDNEEGHSLFQLEHPCLEPLRAAIQKAEQCETP